MMFWTRPGQVCSRTDRRCRIVVVALVPLLGARKALMLPTMLRPSCCTDSPAKTELVLSPSLAINISSSSALEGIPLLVPNVLPGSLNLVCLRSDPKF